MKKADRLFDLIATMTKSEKRYFRLAAEADKKNNHDKYVLLFDFINKQKSLPIDYNSFSSKNKIKNIYALKNVLFKHLLNAIKSYQVENDPNLKIRESMAHTEILRNRNLLDIAGKYIEKNRQNALQGNDPVLYFQLLRQRQFILFYEEDKFRTQPQKVFEEMDHFLDYSRFMYIVGSLEYAQNVMTYFINHLSTASEQQLEKIKALLVAPEMKEVLRFPFLKYKLMYYNNLSNYYWLVKDLKNTYVNRELAYQVAKEYYLKTKETSPAVIATILNFFGTCIHVNEYAVLYKEYLWYRKNIQEVQENVIVFHFRILYEYYFKIANGSNYFIYDEKELKKFEMALEAKGSVMGDGVGKSLILAEVIHYLFKFKKYKKCVQYIYTFFREAKGDVYKKVFLAVDSVRLLCYLEMGDFEILKNEYEYYKKQYAETEFPLFRNAFLEFFESVLKNFNKKKTYKKDLFKKLKPIEKDPAYYYCFAMVNFENW